MFRTLTLSVGFLAAVACGGRGADVASPETRAAAATWVAPDMAFALPLPEGWLVKSSDAIVDQPIYRAEIESVSSEHASGFKPSCRLTAVDFRFVDEFLLKREPNLSSNEVDDLVRIIIGAVEEEVWPMKAYRQMASEGPYDCACDGNNLVGAFESFRAEYISDTEAKSSWHVKFETPQEQTAYLFFASQRKINANMFTQINCAYPSYAERAHRSADDIAALRAAMDRLDLARPMPERAASR